MSDQEIIIINNGIEQKCPVRTVKYYFEFNLENGDPSFRGECVFDVPIESAVYESLKKEYEKRHEKFIDSLHQAASKPY